MHDPQLLGIRPAPAPACVYHLQTPNLMTVAIDVHNDSQHRQLSLPQGGPRRAVTVYRELNQRIPHQLDGIDAPDAKLSVAKKLPVRSESVVNLGPQS